MVPGKPELRDNNTFDGNRELVYPVSVRGSGSTGRLLCDAQQQFNIYLVVVFATIGALIGASINYALAYWIGRPIVYRFANSRIGHMCLIDQAKVEKAEAYFDHHGAFSTFIGRLIPAVRQLISIPAGLARMHFGKFILYTSLGAMLWNIVLAMLGYWLSLFVAQDELMNQIEHYNHYLSIAGYCIAAAIVLFIVYQGIKKK